MAEDIDQLKAQLESLEYVEDIVNRVQRYVTFLSAIPVEQQTAHEKLWLLGYEFVNEKFSPGTPTSLQEAAQLLPILADTIPGDESDPP